LRAGDGAALAAFVLATACSEGEPAASKDAGTTASPPQTALDGGPTPELGGRWKGKRGFWREAPSGEPAVEAEREMIERLRALGYEAGTHAPPLPGGVTLHDPARAFAGRNLMVSGHGAEVLLLDMDGERLHRWDADFESIFPGVVPAAPVEFVRAAHLLADGRLLVVFSSAGLAALDRDSRVLWKSELLAHHDISVVGDEVYALTRASRQTPGFLGEKPYFDDFVSVLALDDGRELRSWSLVDAVRSSSFAERFDPMLGSYGDLLHTNSLQVLDGSAAALHPAFEAGNVLVSILTQDLLAVLDVDTASLAWTYQGGFDGQHDARQHPDGTVTVFDNRGAGKRSRVGRIDLRSEEIVWTHGLGEADRFFTPCCGTAQRLPNGNMLISESEFGRALEVTPDGALVWEFVSPYRAGPDDRYIALLFSLRRFGADFGADWLGP
jgi:hypothetical protein